MSGLFSELRRRNVFRVAAAYLVIGWLLLQVADTVIPALHLPEWIISAITLVLILGFIPMVLFSWAYELTPEGLKKDSEVSANDLASTHTAKKLDVITLIAVVAVMALIAWQQFGTQPVVKTQSDAVIDQLTEVIVEKNPDETETTVYQSIAVLPFVDLSPQSDQAYFSDGIAEEILNVLVKVKALKVASRTSSFGFKGQESQGIPKIAEQLNVRHILEGSVRKSGATVRVTAQLIDADTDQHLWSETYDRELTTENLFAIQDEVASAIVKQLGIALNTESVVNNGSNHLLDLDNYELFLKARALYRSRTELDTADAYLAQILNQDPDFAPAWELRAALPALMVEYGFAEWGFVTVQEKADQFAGQALALNPNSALALAAKANTRAWGAKQELVAQDFQQIILDLKRAIEIDPSLPSPMNWLGMAYATTGQIALAIKAFEQCQQQHPFFAPCVENSYDMQVSAGHYDVAWQLFTQAIEQGISTGTWVNFRLLAQRQERTAFLLGAGSKRLLMGWHRVAEVYDAYQSLDQDHSAMLADILAFAEANPHFDWEYASNLLLPLGAFHLKPFEPAMWGSEYGKYRQSAPFDQYIKGTGVLAYWQQHGFPPQCRAVGEENFSCD
jgi:TolB-like protein